ncbi:trehalase-like protein, partial [Candidatus Woesearchaeota archaeon]|nr:trehalase-like protein [Candidatus Woesearchaeota archaeon]
RGLLRYGFKDAADELLDKTTAAIKKSGFREYYNPLTGEGLGARQFGWSTLVMDMIKNR